ncbi:hypothetical protein AA0119_g12658 [Alternaria tenuissima]|uniref:Uncharacterized protein n=1 Tax=Alternaria tenuissima TaxID=119927 RepID=A0ABY0FT46_9PLEO|nr:hypothetical protein AA0120_g12248 [Alternaria tenuissima]RYN86674.1 hypothetical protein AA0119_g12658 [Alternaria tenuissima]RYO04420.1 hypothetical protein AA0121_g12775 [Alternaria tenuissima]
MFSKASLLLSLLSLTTVLAAPMEVPVDHRLEDIQCRSLSFSTNAKPTVCTYLESHGLDWNTAYSLASDYDLKIQFASQSTISKVLSIPKSLPRSMLQSLSNGAARPPNPTDLIKSQNKIVCGLGDGVKRMGSDDSNLGPEYHCVSVVVTAFMLFLILYLVGLYVWTRRFGSQQGNIQLESDEKVLTS